MTKINSYLDNFEATKRRNELAEQSKTRYLSDQERNELEEIIDEIDRFEELVLLNFD